ncbi:Ig-like domain-containing protein [Limibacter armeniacum]|uniref:Ig-like domain-containing protein n=1 Tax=Limibacter armeniacum TaxID=466084 RepID=UPI002FE6B03C
MKNPLYILILLMLLWLSGCIGDDIIQDRVEERVVIVDFVDSLSLEATYQFKAEYQDSTGVVGTNEIEWQSSDTNIAIVDAAGNVKGVSEGTTMILAQATGQQVLSDSVMLVVSNELEDSVGMASREGQIVSTSSYELKGSFKVESINGGILISIDDTYKATDALPGLYLYLSNNPSTIAGALEIGPVQVFEGAHTYTVPEVTIGSYEYLLYYCKPFNVKVGEGQIQ